jgi:GalNAc-alpha-(1->4)-GalNAc-alpha-(1->3)-diNAcBac-PP-undecaprenol alpha-1,4-N-acetyl-D-galactosaminyltransferase
MNTDKSICFIVPSLQLGGLENAASIIVNYLAAQGIKVTILTLFKFPHFYSLDENITIIDPPFRKTKSFKIIYYLKIILFLRKHIKIIKPNRILSYGDWSNILILIACIGLSQQPVISDRASPGLKFQWYVSLLRKVFYAKAGGIIAQTERAAMQKRRMLGNKVNIKIIPNPVKQVRLFPEIQRENLILGVGRHWHVKGLDRLIEAFALLGNTDYQLIIAGSTGPATPLLVSQIKKYNLQGKISFLEKVKELDKLAARCRIFVLPSRSEGFPNALIESMAAGLACISFDVNAGPADIINNGHDGLLVENNNISELAKKIRYLTENEPEIIRLGQNALQIRERLSLEIIGKEYMDFIFYS